MKIYKDKEYICTIDFQSYGQEIKEGHVIVPLSLSHSTQYEMTSTEVFYKYAQYKEPEKYGIPLNIFMACFEQVEGL